MLVLFRFRTQENSITEIKVGDKDWIGIAHAKNAKELFWLIDEFGDPNSCQILKCGSKGAAVCLQVTYDKTEGFSEEEDGLSIRPHHFRKGQNSVEFDELSNSLITESEGWHTPNWKNIL